LKSADSSKTGRIANCAENLILMSNFKGATNFKFNFYAFQMKRFFVLLKPMHFRFAVLDLSRQKMYDIHYLYMNIKIQEKLVVIPTPTDKKRIICILALRGVA